MQRNTRQRAIIADAIVGQYKHVSARDVYDQCNALDKTISLATVYRTLNTLLEEGKISAIHNADEQVIYDGNIEPHDHMVCSECGKIIDLAPIVSTHRLKTLQKDYNFKINHVQLVFEGLCEDCRKR